MNILGTPQIFVTFKEFYTWLVQVVVFAFTNDVFRSRLLAFWCYFMRYIKMKLLVCQSIRRLCKTNHDNPMTIGFVGDEMSLKATLLVCILIITFKALVSCVTSLEERLWPSMTSQAINMLFFTRVILCHHANSLLMKHTYAL